VNPEAFSQASDLQRGFETISSGFQNEVKEDDLTFWVDPLDGSSGLAEGHTEHLTCIIGVAVQNRPLLGIVHKPFAGSAISKTYVGLPETGLFAISTPSRRSTSESTIEALGLNYSRISRERDVQPRVCASHNAN
jgi:3'-phosphoadenosine 5'-phosphosulfate (PAPS) 3'-phosphatase